MGISHINSKSFRPNANSAFANGELCDRVQLLNHSELHPCDKCFLNILSRQAVFLALGSKKALALPSQNGSLQQNKHCTSKRMITKPLEGTNWELGSRITGWGAQGRPE